jgi:hypothetical protein
LIVVVRCTDKAVLIVSFAEQMTTHLPEVLINSQPIRDTNVFMIVRGAKATLIDRTPPSDDSNFLRDTCHAAACPMKSPIVAVRLTTGWPTHDHGLTSVAIACRLPRFGRARPGLTATLTAAATPQQLVIKNPTSPFRFRRAVPVRCEQLAATTTAAHTLPQ